MLLFVSGCFHRSGSDPYILRHPKGPASPLPKTLVSHSKGPISSFPKPREATAYPRSSLVVIEDFRLPLYNRTKLLYHVNKTTDNLWLCIPPTVAPGILQIAYREGQLSFSRCYKIVTSFWYIRGLTRLLRNFIQHCAQCLQLQTRRHRPYEFLQPIESLPVPFFPLTLDFVLTLPLTK